MYVSLGLDSMGRIVWLLSILVFPLSASASKSMKTCPYPLPKTIEPCSCKIDQTFQVHLICNINKDMDEELLRKLTNAFAVNNDIHLFGIDLNGNKWTADFSPDLIGKFRMSHFHLSNFRSIDGNIKAGAFNEALKEFLIETSGKTGGGGQRHVGTGAFSKLPNLKKVSLGKDFATIKSKAFSDLPNFEELIVDERTLAQIEYEAFESLPMLKSLNFSYQSITSLSPKAFSNLSNIKEINLSKNQKSSGFFGLGGRSNSSLGSSGSVLGKIEHNTFFNLPSLVRLDLSGNRQLCHIGNMFINLKNQDLAINLAETNVNILLEDAFKPFIDTVTENNGKGSVDMSSIPLQCGCDAKWLANTTVKWTDIIKNGACQDGTQLDEVDWTIHEKRCPPENSPGYDAGYGQMYPSLLASKDSGSLTSPDYPDAHYTNYVYETYEITALNGPIDISFTDFYISKRKNNYVSITDGDGTVLLEKTGGRKIPRNVTSKTNKALVEFGTSPNIPSRNQYYSNDRFKLNWQGQGGFITDRSLLCECC